MQSVNIFYGAKRKDQQDPRDWQFANLAENKATAMFLPTSASLKAGFPKIYTQTCGNCTSNAVLACNQYYYTNPKNPSTVFTYYNQRMLDKSGWDEDDGSSVESALKSVKKFGACANKMWPNTHRFSDQPDAKAYANGIKGHEIVKWYNCKSLLQIKKALVAGYPVATAMDWIFRDYDRITYTLEPWPDKASRDKACGHAVVIVGYNDNSDVFEIRNSWGDQWGNAGYAYIKYNDMRKIIWFDDTYAIVR